MSFWLIFKLSLSLLSLLLSEVIEDTAIGSVGEGVMMGGSDRRTLGPLLEEDEGDKEGDAPQPSQVRVKRRSLENTPGTASRDSLRNTHTHTHTLSLQLARV